MAGTLCSTPVMAESKVQLYGFLTGAYGYYRSSSSISSDARYRDGLKVTEERIGNPNSMMLGPRWGMRGTEDLGNGNEAKFELESSFNMMDGRSTMGGLFAREAYVGISNPDYGSLTLGRQYNASADLIGPMSTYGASLATQSFRYVFGGAMWDRYSNMIKYTSPKIGGLQWVAGTYIQRRDEFDPKDMDQKHGRSMGVTTGLRYEYGPLTLAGSFDFSRQKGDIADAPLGYNTPALGAWISPDKNMTRKAFNLGMNYQFDSFKLHVLYGAQFDGAFFDGGLFSYLPMPDDMDKQFKRSMDKGLRHHSWEVGATVPVSTGVFKMAYYGSILRNNHVGTGSRGDMTQFNATYLDTLSKHTSAYIGASYAITHVKNFDDWHTRVSNRQVEGFVGLAHYF